MPSSAASAPSCGDAARGSPALHCKFLLSALTLATCCVVGVGPATVAGACTQPDQAAISAAFDLAGNGLLPATAPALPLAGPVHNIPPTLLKAVGWVESGWRQFDGAGKPLIAPDFGYGIMQITSGMAGAFGNVRGNIPQAAQSSVASDYVYNIAYGAQILADKWSNTPRIGNGDPAVIENWYYALWAYNGWGWVNNPNNPRFTRVGTPAQNPETFPYQERVLYLVQHPPHDVAGNPLWKAIHVTLPAAGTIGTSPHTYTPLSMHTQPVPTLSAVYRGGAVLSALPGATVVVPIRVENTGTLAWPSSGILAVSLTYHLMTLGGNPWTALSPFSKGIVSFAQGQTLLPRAVLPGNAVVLRIPVRAPAGPGSYRVVWDLQQGADTWFSQRGVLPRVALLRIDAGPTSSPTATTTPVATVTAVEDAKFVRDTSIPDGTILAPQQQFDKGWLLFNSGVTGWSSDWSLRHVSGSKFGFTSLSLPITPKCHTLNLVIGFTAPRRAGSYHGAWRLFDSSGAAVGDRLTIVITVRGSTGGPTPTPAPSPSPTPAGRPTPTATPTPVG